MILFPGRHLMGVLECHYLTPPNKMVELNAQLCVKNWVEFMVEVQIRIFLMDKVEVQVRTLLREKELKSYLLLYHTDPQVEVQFIILLKEAAIVSKMRTPAITLSFPEHRFKENFYLDFFIKEKQFASQVDFLVKSKH